MLTGNFEKVLLNQIKSFLWTFIIYLITSSKKLSISRYSVVPPVNSGGRDRGGGCTYRTGTGRGCSPSGRPLPPSSYWTTTAPPSGRRCPAQCCTSSSCWSGSRPLVVPWHTAATGSPLWPTLRRLRNIRPLSHRTGPRGKFSSNLPESLETLVTKWLWNLGVSNHRHGFHESLLALF